MIIAIKIIKLDDYWHTGEIGNCGFEAKVYDEPSEYGIEGGRISKLFVRDKQRNVILSYDRGWDVQPTDELGKNILETIMHYFK